MKTILRTGGLGDVADLDEYEKARRSNKWIAKPKETRICVVCKREFRASVGKKKVTCSFECGSAYHAEQVKLRSRKDAGAKKAAVAKLDLRLTDERRHKLMITLFNFEKLHVYANANVIAAAAGCHPTVTKELLKELRRLKRVQTVRIACTNPRGSTTKTETCYQLSVKK